MVWNAVGIPNQMSSIIERLRSMFSGRESADDRIRDAIEYAAMDIHDVCADVPHERITAAVHVLAYMIKTDVPVDGHARALQLAMDRAAILLCVEEHQERLFDERIEQDVRAGKLDWLAEEALAEHRARTS